MRLQEHWDALKDRICLRLQCNYNENLNQSASFMLV